jgi:hypothetical protein
VRSRISALAVVLCALAGCGGGASSEDAGSSGGQKDAAADNVNLRTGPARDRIEEMFKVYREALVEGDYVTACARLAPESVEALQRNVKKNGVEEDSCAETLEAVYDSVPDEQRRVLVEVSRRARIERVVVARDRAVLVWSTVADGEPVKLRHAARRIGEEWKLIDTNSTPSG